jgi:hypothetical protein
MKTQALGPAAQLIDFGYAVKLPLSQAVDATFGISTSAPWSLTGFLQVCYEMRRPSFEFLDSLWGLDRKSL